MLNGSPARSVVSLRPSMPAGRAGRRRRTSAASRPGAWLALMIFAWFLAPPPVRAAAPAPAKTIVFFGDSLTAGYGLEDPAEAAFPARIAERITSAHLPYRVVNAGLSGETSAGGLRRVDWILRQPIDLFVLALGGNDGLRGIEPAVMRENLQGIIDKVRAKQPAARIVLVGLQMPPSMGEDYTRAFAAVYPSLAEKNGLTLVPFLLEGVGGRADLNQPDGIHPTAAGHTILATTVWKVLQPLL